MKKQILILTASQSSNLKFGSNNPYIWRSEIWRFKKMQNVIFFQIGAGDRLFVAYDNGEERKAVEISLLLKMETQDFEEVLISKNDGTIELTGRVYENNLIGKKQMKNVKSPEGFEVFFTANKELLNELKK